MTESSHKVPHSEQPSLVERLACRTIDEHGILPKGAGIVVGVSGGPDSLCLLHVLLQMAPARSWRIYAGHLNHQLRGSDSDGDARHVEALCHDWGVPCIVSSRDIARLAGESKCSIEETARQERYRFLGDVARKHACGYVVVAHHADDQVETILMHLLRGSGLAGLRGMLPSAPLPNQPELTLVRPLLGVSRQEILAYCQNHDIVTRLDQSNLDTTYYRNRIRHELVPTLESYNPNFRETLLRSASSLSADYDIVATAVDRTWAQLVQHQDDRAVALDRAGLRELPVGLARRLLRKTIWLLRSSLRDISWVHVEDALRIVRRNRTGAQATLPGGLVLTLGYKHVWIADKHYAPPVEAPAIVSAQTISFPGSVALDDGWYLHARFLSADDLPPDWPSNTNPRLAYAAADRLTMPLTIRSRQPGDRFVPLGSMQSQSLKRFMINARIPAQLRDRVPLLLCGDRIMWVVGWRLDARFALSSATRRVLALCCTQHDKEPA